MNAGGRRSSFVSRPTAIGSAALVINHIFPGPESFAWIKDSLTSKLDTFITVPLFSCCSERDAISFTQLVIILIEISSANLTAGFV